VTAKKCRISSDITHLFGSTKATNLSVRVFHFVVFFGVVMTTITRIRLSTAWKPAHKHYTREMKCLTDWNGFDLINQQIALSNEYSISTIDIKQSLFWQQNAIQEWAECDVSLDTV